MKNVVRFTLLVVIASCFGACASKKAVSTKTDVKDLNTDGISSVSKKESRAQYQYINAEGLFLIEEYENALSSLDTVLVYSPNNAAVFHKKSQCYEKLEQLDDAVEMSLKAIALNKSNEFYHVQLAHIYEIEKDHLKTIGAYENLVSSVSNSDKYYLEIAENYNELALSSKKKHQFHEGETSGEDKVLASSAKAEQEKFEEKTVNAYSNYEKSYELSEEQFLRKQELLLSLGKKDEAVSESLNRLNNYHPEQLWYHVSLLSNLNSTQEAISFMDSESVKGVSDLEKARVKGLLLALNNQNSEARDQFLKIFHLKNVTFKDKASALRTMLDSNTYSNLVPLVTADVHEYATAVVSAEASELLGDFYSYNSNNDVSAQKAYIASLNITPDQEQVLMKVVRSSKRIKDSKSVIKYGEKLLGLTEIDVDVYEVLADAYVESNENLKAVSVLEKGLALAEDDYKKVNDFHQALAVIHEKTGTYDKMFFYIQQSLEYDINNAEVINTYCEKILAYDGDLDEARAHGERMIRLFPTESKYLKTYALVLNKDEDFTRSLAYIEKSIGNGQNDWSTYELAGDIAKNAGNLAKAKTYWQKSKSLGNSSTELENKINE